MHRRGQIDKPGCRCAIENAEKAHHLQSPLDGRTSGLKVVENDQIRSQILGEKDRVPLARMKAAQIPRRSRNDRMDLQPSRRICHPFPERERSLGVPKLRGDSRGDEQPIVKAGQDLDVSDQQKVGNRRGIEDYLQWPESPRKVSISSRRSASV